MRSWLKAKEENFSHPLEFESQSPKNKKQCATISYTVTHNFANSNFSFSRMDEESAIEYDCNTSFLGVTDYCLHFMSKNPTLSEEKLKQMMDFAG